MLTRHQRSSFTLTSGAETPPQTCDATFLTGPNLHLPHTHACAVSLAAITFGRPTLTRVRHSSSRRGILHTPVRLQIARRTHPRAFVRSREGQQATAGGAPLWMGDCPQCRFSPWSPHVRCLLCQSVGPAGPDSCIHRATQRSPDHPSRTPRRRVRSDAGPWPPRSITCEHFSFGSLNLRMARARR